MASISQLGYLGIGTMKAKAWQDLATSILGLQLVPGNDPNSFFLRMDEYHHRLEFRPKDTEDLDFVGWEVPDSATLHRVAQQLEDGGVKVTPGSREEIDSRRVLDLVKCLAPDGIPTEIFCGRPVNQAPFHPARPMSGFKTGHMGLGHILLFTHNLDESIRFYRDLLGFRVSDFSDVPTPRGTLRLAFLHCNPRHHSIAFLETPDAPKRLNHIMFECNSLDDVGSSRDLCLQHGVPIAIELGRHMNDHMVSFYLVGPSGFALECGWGARIIDDTTWRVEHYKVINSLWGHPQLASLANGPAPEAASEHAEPAG